MATLRSIGCLVGEYVGDGQGESETATLAPVSVDNDLVDAELGDGCQNLVGGRGG